MKSLFETARQTVVDEVIRSGREIHLPQSLQPQVMRSLHDRLQTKKKITRSDIKKTIRYIKYTSDLRGYTKHFFDKNYYGLPLELLKGFNNFIDHVYDNDMLQKFSRSRQLFRSFEFNNSTDYYNFTSTTIMLHFYIILLKYKAKLYILLYDTESHNLHFALPICQDY